MENVNELKTRHYELDWLRVLAFGILIFYHTGMMFVSWEFHITNSEHSIWMEYWMVLVNRWRLPLLFFVSGAGVYYALKNRSALQFSSERFQRLFIPLVFGMFVIVPPQIYFERLSKGATFTYFEFYPSVFEFVSYPQGSFSWHHLWFICYLFFYSLLALPLFLYLKSTSGKQMMKRAALWLSKGGNIYLFLVPALIGNLALQPYFPTTHNLVWDWANFTVSFYVFIMGYLFGTSQVLIETLKKQRFVSLGFALFFTVTTYTLWISGIHRVYLSETVRTYLWLVIDSGMGGFFLFAIVGFAKAHLTFQNQFLIYTNRAVYPFYIIHQTIIIWIGYYVIQWHWNLWAKFFLVSFATYVLSILFYEIVKRTAVTRFFLGIKKEKKMPDVEQRGTEHLLVSGSLV